MRDGDPAPARTAPRAAGLCDTCRHARVVTSARGARYIRCGRSDFDAGYARYPRLPMHTCEGFEARND